MDFKKRRLNKALEDKTYRVKLVHSNKGWLAVGLTFITLFSATMLSQKTVDASAVNNVAVANSTTSSSVQLYNSVTDSSMHKANRGLANGTAWKTAKAVKGVDGQTYLLVGGNEYANANQMDLADETSSQDLSGIVRTNANKAITRLYTNPLADGGANLITNRGLAKNTAWKTDTKVVVNGQTYYRVATNEWVKADDAYLTSESSRSDKTYTNNAPDAEVTDTDNNNNGGSSNNSGSGSTTTPEAKTATVTVKYVDENDKEIATAKTLEDKQIGSTVTEKAIDVDGYTLTSDATQNVTVAKDGNTITFTYKKTDTTPVEEQGKVIVRYIDEDGNNVADEETATQKVGTNFLATARSLEGYTVKGDFTKNVTVTKEDIVVTFTYTKDAPEVTKADVTVNYVDSEGNPLQESKTLNDQEVGQDVTETAPEIAGYTVDKATQTLTVAKDNNVITFTYTKDAVVPEKATITTKYVDESGKEIVDATTATAEVGKDFTAKAIAVDGYTVKGDATQTATVEGDKTVTFTYTKNAPVVEKANVTVNYVDSEGKTLQDAKTLTDQEVGKDVTETAPEIDGYTVDKATKTVTVAKDGSATITFTYTKNAEPVQNSTITTKFVDKDGKELAKSTSETVKNGDQYTAKAVDVDGYTLDGDATQTIDSVNGDATLTFTYTKNAPVVEKANVTVNYVDSEGNPLQDTKTLTDQTVGKDVTETAPEIDGYTVDEATKTVTVAKDGSATITFTYTKNAPVVEKADVTVNYVDSEGKTLQDAKTLTDQTVGKDVTETAPEIDGYTVDKATQTLTVAKDNNVITFTYTKNAPATLDTTEVANKIVSLVNEYRQQNGLSALNTDANLTAGAVARANTEAGHVNSTGNIDSANHDEFTAQTQPNLVQYGSTNMAENLAINGGSTADELAQTLVDQWKKSPDHNATMLDKSMTDIGVGVKQLDNGQYVAIQDFGGNAQSGVTWDSSRFNSTTIDSVGVTTDSIKQQLQTTYGVDLGTNYYISDHIFKTKSDYDSFMASTFESPSPLEGSIWGIGGTDGNNGTALVYDANGNAVGWALYSANMDKTLEEAQAEGLTTWIK